MSLLHAFIANPVKVAVGVLIVALFGGIALVRMPMQLIPEVQTPTLTISTHWPGASPQEVEREIILEQEAQLKGVEGVTRMSSESSDSLGQVILEFAVGTNMNEALLSVNSRLAQVREYPLEADQPVISTSNVSDRPIAFFMLSHRPPDMEQVRAAQAEHPHLADKLEGVLRAHSPPLAVYRLQGIAAQFPEIRYLLPEPVELERLRRFTEDYIAARFARVRGVSSADVRGGQHDELRVLVNPDKLAARQLTIYDVRNALRDENKDTSAGDFWEGKRRYVVRTLGQFRSPEQVEDVLLAVRDNSPVYIRDVADVSLTYKKPDSVVRRFGESGVNVSVSRETGANVLEVMNGLRAASDELNEGTLKERGLQLVQVYDETDYIYSAIGLVKNNILIGGFLTIVVLVLFLRSVRSTLVIALAIPTSIIGTFLILSLLGRSLNVISLAGLAFAVGMLVDNAVVVLENIYTHYQRGESPFAAAAKGAKEVWGAIIASTFTTLAVFLPVVFVEEEAGQIFRDIALAISAAVGLSMIVSIVVIPVAASRIFKKRAVGGGGEDADDMESAPGSLSPGRFTALLDRGGTRFVAAVMSLNGWLQQSAGRQLGVVVLLVASAIGVGYLLIPKVEYLPTGNRNLVLGNLLPPPGYNLDQMLRIGGQVEERILPYWDIDPGSPQAAASEYPIVADFFFMARGRRVFLGLRALDPMRANELIPLVKSITADLPGTFSVARQSSLFERGINAGRTIDVEITGPELPRLIELGERVLAMAGESVPESQLLPIPSLDLSSPEVHLVPLRQRGKELEMHATELGYTVDALVDGAYATDYYVEGNKIDLTIAGLDSYAARTQDLRNLPVATRSGKLVTLDALAHIHSFRTGPEQVNRRERERAVTIQVTPPASLPLEEAQDRLGEQVVDVLRQEGALAGGYQVRLAGTSDKLRQTWQALHFNVVLALLITYLLMAGLFESWLYPLVIILTVPLGAAGGIGALWLLNRIVAQPLDVLTMLGFVMLIGTVVNNPILIVHQSLNYMRADQLAPREAILHSLQGRIRPIFMTTFTTVLGLLPLVVFPGAGSELYRGIGAVMIGGLLVSTIFTLVLVPSLFSLAMQGRAALVGQLALATSTVGTFAEKARRRPASNGRDVEPALAGERANSED